MSTLYIESLSDRASVANMNGAEVFLSIHFNGDSSPITQGTETWTHSICTGDSTLLAQSIQQRIVLATSYNNRGVKAKQLGVLSLNSQSVATACCLVEISFLTDPNEENRLEPAITSKVEGGAVRELDVCIAKLLRQHFKEDTFSLCGKYWRRYRKRCSVCCNDLASALTQRPAAQTGVAEDFRNSRSSGWRIGTPQCNLFKSIFASHTSVDLSISSQVTSLPVYAAVRAIMQESADSAPFDV